MFAATIYKYSRKKATKGRELECMKLPNYKALKNTLTKKSNM